MGNIIDAGCMPTTLAGLHLFAYAPVPRLDWLVAKGFNPRRRFIWSPTALQLAVASEDCDIDRVKFLLQAGVNINAAPPWGIGPYQFDDMRQENFSLDRRPIGNFTALQHAVNNGDGDLVQLLVDHGAFVNARAASFSGATALQLAAARGDNGILRYLIHKSASINPPKACLGSRTAPEGAAEHGRIDTVSLLLSEDCRITGAYRHQITGAYRHQYIRAVAFAQKEGHDAVARLLQDVGEWKESDEDSLKAVDVERDEEKVKERWKKLSSCDCGSDGCDEKRSIGDEIREPPCWFRRFNTPALQLDEPDTAKTEDPLHSWLHNLDPPV